LIQPAPACRLVAAATLLLLLLRAWEQPLLQLQLWELLE
jgi:hypothetical protein